MSANRDKVRSQRAPVLSQRAEYELLGSWIRKLREERGIGQKPLSRKLGKPEVFLNKVEHGRQRIDLVEFADLLRELHAEPEELAKLITALQTLTPPEAG